MQTESESGFSPVWRPKLSTWYNLTQVCSFLLLVVSLSIGREVWSQVIVGPPALLFSGLKKLPVKPMCWHFPHVLAQVKCFSSSFQNWHVCAPATVTQGTSVYTGQLAFTTYMPVGVWGSHFITLQPFP